MLSQTENRCRSARSDLVCCIACIRTPGYEHFSTDEERSPIVWKHYQNRALLFTIILTDLFMQVFTQVPRSWWTFSVNLTFIRLRSSHSHIWACQKSWQKSVKRWKRYSRWCTKLLALFEQECFRWSKSFARSWADIKQDQVFFK